MIYLKDTMNQRLKCRDGLIKWWHFMRAFWFAYALFEQKI